MRGCDPWDELAAYWDVFSRQIAPGLIFLTSAYCQMMQSIRS